MATIDSLVIEIDSDASQASQGIDKLAASLRGLKAETSGQIKGLNNIANGIRQLSGAFKDIANLKEMVDSGAVQSLNEMTNALQNLASLNGIKLSTSFASQITAIGNAVKSLEGIDFSPVKQLAETMRSASDAVSGIQNLSNAASSLKNVSVSTQSLSGAADAIKALSDAAGNVDSQKAQNLSMLANALLDFGAFEGFKLSSSIANQINAIASATKGLEGTPWGELKTMADSLAPIANIQKSNGLNNTVNSLRKMPDAIKAIKDLDPTLIAEFTARVEELKTSIQPLADEMRAVSAGFSALPANIQKAIKANQKLTASNNTTSRSMRSLLSHTLRLGTILYGVRRAAGFVMDVFQESNDYVEALNLAEVAMGSYAEDAKKFAQQVEDVIGINQKDWLSQMGTFNQMLAGFGIDRGQAAKMSQQLTQLGYDIQSAFNVSDVNQAMERLQSGLAGQIKGMREYGVELSVGAMKEYALAKGITTSWTEMSQAEKVALRYSKIMESTKNIQQDLARTIVTPSNSLRLLNSQWSVAQRYMGQFVSVIAAQVIPIVQTLVAVIAAAARALASLWGYALPSLPAVDGVAGAFDDVSDSLDDVGASAGGAGGKMKGLLADWDEINVIQSESGGGGGGGGAAALAAVGDLWDLTDYAYDFLNGIESKTAAIMDEVSDWWEDWHRSVYAFLASILARKIGSKIYDVAKYLGASADQLKGISRIATGLALSITGVALSWDGIQNIVTDGVNTANILATVGGTIADIIGFGMIGSGLSKVTGLKVSAFKFGVGMALSVDGLALSYAATKNMVTEGINATNILEDVGGAIATAIGVGTVAISLGATWPIAIALGAIAAVSVGIGSVILYNELSAQELAKNAFANSGEGGLSPDEVVTALQEEFKSRTSGVELVIDAYSGVKTFKDDVQKAADNINALNQAVLGPDAPTAEQITELKDAWSGFDDAVSGLSNATFDTIFAGLNAAIDSEISTISEKAAEFQTQLLIIQEGLTESQAKNKIKRDKILDEMLAGTASDEDREWYAKYSHYMSTSKEQYMWDEMVRQGFTVDFSDSKNALQDAKQYMSDLQMQYAELEKLNNESIGAFEESIAEKKYEVFQQWDMGDISEDEYKRQIAELDGMLAVYKDFINSENELARQDVANLYVSLLEQALSPEVLSSFDGDVKALENYINTTVNDLISTMYDSGMLSEQQKSVLDQISSWFFAPNWGTSWDDEFVVWENGSPTKQLLSDKIKEMLSGLIPSIDESDIPDTTVSPDVTVKPELTLEQSAADYAGIQQDIQDGVEQNMPPITAEAVVDVQTEVPEFPINPVIDMASIASEIEIKDTPEVDVEPVIHVDPIVPEITAEPVVDVEPEVPPVTVDSVVHVETITPDIESIKDALSTEELTQFSGNGEALDNYLRTVIWPMQQALEQAGLISQEQSDILDRITLELYKSDMPDWENAFMPGSDVSVLDWVEQMMSQFSGENGQGLQIPLGAESSQLDDTLSGELTYVQDTWNPGMVAASTFSIPAPDTSAARAALNGLYQYAQSVYRAMGSRSYGGGIRYGRGPSYATVQYTPSTPTFTVPAYANGGFPKEGQLFLANEQAPELVGQIGSRTAVANDSQIVEGISGGVERANSRLERKMDEFISIARQLVAKDSRIVIEPSAALGKVNQRSAEMYQRARG